MTNLNRLRSLALTSVCALLFSLGGTARADEVTEPEVAENATLFDRASSALDETLGEALSLLGVPYRRGGSSPTAGFDCSGFVRHVFQESVGLILPHNANAMAREGETVDRDALQPGDLVFFNTMRRAFSHVGIYLGDGKFVHSPRKGGRVRIEDMQESYWKKRYNGARRVAPDQ
ncbi:MAG: C40 family peptidase [Rhodocyclaceae bacterium]|jgi:cell wall-associated NlpC family hydrolase|nr:C40 family peptidase [Rhodocyclaceae bacterium]